MIYEDSRLYLVMELCQSNLAEMIRQRKAQRGAFIDAEIKTYMKDILEGVNFLHKQSYIHRDLKPENILVACDNKLKISDFGTARNIKSKLPLTTYVSTRWYRAPECILEVKKYDSKSDVFALG